ncbi:MAG TPA: serine/threonine-protein kinase, partial [Verrucomicrobiae bacterium]|nr:serine/threonine-protein kinase [Verrucomicrobiae bacterium]
MTGKRFGDYKLLEEIARGGMGVVYKAHQLSLERFVAIKILLFGPHATPELVKRFRIEASSAAALQHPNIVAIHEVGVFDDEHYLVMDLVDGPNLAAVVKERPLPSDHAARYLKRIAEAIHYAHERGILHRDLKPSNVLIDSSDQPRVTDFGLAKRLSGEASSTMSVHMLGSPAYMPPEQAGASRVKVGRYSDVYSLGAMLYHLITGRPPFAGESVADILRLVQTQEPLSPRQLNSSVPLDLETICLKCLQKEPRRRYTSAQELAEELGRVLENEPIKARPVGTIQKIWRWCGRNRALGSVGAAAIVVLLAGASVSMWQAVRARNAERAASAEAAKYEELAGSLQEMIEAVRPSIALGRDTTLLREILDKAAARTDQEFRHYPEGEADLRRTIGESYGHLGEYAKAETQYRRSLAIETALHGPEHVHAAHSLNGLGKALGRQGKFEAAEAAHRQAVKIARRLLPHDHPDMAVMLGGLAQVFLRQGKLRAAETTQREVVRIR